MRWTNDLKKHAGTMWMNMATDSIMKEIGGCLCPRIDGRMLNR